MSLFCSLWLQICLSSGILFSFSLDFAWFFRDFGYQPFCLSVSTSPVFGSLFHKLSHEPTNRLPDFSVAVNIVKGTLWTRGNHFHLKITHYYTNPYVLYSVWTMLYCVTHSIPTFFFLTLLLPFLFWHPSSPFPVYFYIKHTIHFYPAAYKCTINKLVVCNHRMWPKANSEQMLTCQPCDPIWQRHSSAAPMPQQEEERKQVIHMSDSNLPQQTHNCSHWVLPPPRLDPSFFAVWLL